MRKLMQQALKLPLLSNRTTRRFGGLWSSDRALQKQRLRAQDLRRDLDRFVNDLEDRLALPRIGNQAVVYPAGADVRWRPPLWRNPLSVSGVTSPASGTHISDHVRVFHDCPKAHLALRQTRSIGTDHVAAFALQTDVYEFEGSYFSIAVDLPEAAWCDLSQHHVLRLDTHIALEAPLEIFARLNVLHGPNTAQIVQELAPHTAVRRTEFDLAYANINMARVSSVWVDLIFDAPSLNQITLQDLTLCRFARGHF